MELRWQISSDASAMHAVWAIASGRTLVDAALHAQLAPLASELLAAMRQSQLPERLFWRHLIAMAVDWPSNQQLAERLLMRLAGGQPSAASVSRLASHIAECEAVLRRQVPRLPEELALRVGPLQSAWEARGPGLLAMMRRMTADDFLVDSAGVILVQPVAGGGGLAHVWTNRVHMEAVLTDIDPRLPECLRLAWLLGQLNLDRPVYSEEVHGHELVEVAELALLPVVLSAGEEVQLAALSPSSIELALLQWTRTPAELAPALAEVLLAWFDTAFEGDWDWNTRLTALAHMCRVRGRQ